MFAAVISFFAACQIVEQPLTTPESGEMIEMTVVATQGNGAQTKTHLASPVEGNYPVLWDAEGESMEVIEWAYNVDVTTAESIDKSTNLVRTECETTTYTLSDDAKKATFTGVSFDEAAESFINFEYAFVSPSNIAARYGRNSGNPGVKVNLPSIQTPRANSYDPAAGFILGYSGILGEQPTTIDACLRHVMAYAKMTIKNLDCGTDKITSVEFISNKNIYGSSFTYDFVTEEITINSEKKVLCLDVSELTLNGSSFDVFFATLPIEFEAGDNFAVKVVTDAGKIYVKENDMTAEKLLPLNRGEITSFSVDFTGIAGVDEIQDVTVARFGEQEVSDYYWYRLVGRISDLAATSGKLTLTDVEGNTTTTYRAAPEKGGSYSNFPSLNLQNGDVIEIIGKRGEYESAPQIVDGYYSSHARISISGTLEYQASSTGTLTIKSLKPNTAWTLSVSSGAGFTASATSGTTGSDGTSSVTITATAANSGSEVTSLGTIEVTMGGFDFSQEVMQSLNPSLAKYYTKVTAAPSDWSGTYLMVCENESKALSSLSTTSTIYGVGSVVEISEGKIVQTPENETWECVISKVSGKDYYTISFGGKYLNWSTGNSLTSVDAVGETCYWNISLTDGVIRIANVATITNPVDLTKERVIWWNVGSPRFACYTNKTNGNSYIAPSLFKLEE